jgi:predicted DNA binding CopG/RHH family protein
MIPSFTSEAEEAQWWFEHSDELDKDFEQAAADGTLGHGTLARRFDLKSNLIRIEPRDADTARVLAAQRGLEYEKYVQRLIHDALEQELKAS